MSQNSKITNWKYTLGRVLLFCIVNAILLMVGSALTHQLARPWSDILLAGLAGIFVFSVTVLFVRWEGLRLSDVGVIPGKLTFFHLVIGVFIGMLLVGLHVALKMIYGHLSLNITPDVRFSSVVITLLLYCLLALREELAFRGYPLRSLNYGIGAWKAQIIIAMIFSLEHLAGGYTWMQAFFGAGIGAILFGIAALKTKGIALPIGLHAAWNFGQWCVGFKNEPGIWQAVVEKGYEAKQDQIGFMSYILVMGLAILSFYFYQHKTSIDSSVIHG